MPMYYHKANMLESSQQFCSYGLLNLCSTSIYS